MENGRQVSGAITRIASQPRSVPKVMQGFRAAGDGTVDRARAQHVKGKPDRMGRRGAGARHREGRSAQPTKHGNLTCRRIHHQLGNGKRKHARLFLKIDAAETFIKRGLPADAGADDGRGPQRQRHVEGNRRLRDRLARGHHRELRDAVERGKLTLLEMLERVEILDLGGNLLGQLFRRRSQCDRPDSVDTLLEVGPVGGGRVPKRRDGAEAGDNDAVHVTHDFLSTNCWIALTTSPTVPNSVRGLLVLAL